MKKIANLFLDEAEIIELVRILTDDDAENALVFLKTHFKDNARKLLESG